MLNLTFHVNNATIRIMLPIGVAPVVSSCVHNTKTAGISTTAHHPISSVLGAVETAFFISLHIRWQVFGRRAPRTPLFPTLNCFGNPQFAFWKREAQESHHTDPFSATQHHVSMSHFPAILFVATARHLSPLVFPSSRFSGGKRVRGAAGVTHTRRTT